MRKNIYTLLGIAALLFSVSCLKEEDKNTDSKDGTQDLSTLAPNIPTSISVSYIDTKTSYDEDGKFIWAVGDEVDLIFVKKNGDGAVISQGWVAYEIADGEALTNEGRKATFTIKADQDAKTNASTGALKDYENSHFAVYGKGATAGRGVARPYLSEGNTISIPEFAHPMITFQQYVTGASSEVILIGEESDGVFNFQTAAAVLKVIVSNIPATATELRLYTTNSSVSPIDGDFILDDTTPKEIKKGDYTKYGSGNVKDSCHPYLSAAVNGSASQTFYFNIPTGTYAASTLKLRLLDSDQNVLIQKGIGSEFSFVRNDLVETTLTCPSTSTVSVHGNANDPLLDTTKGDGAQTIRVYVSTAPLTDNNYTSDDWRGNNKFGGSTSKYRIATLYSDDNDSQYYLDNSRSSGKLYLQWIACTNDTKPGKLTDSNVRAYGSVPFYYINGNDAKNRSGQYTYAYGTIKPNSQAAKPNEVTITLGVSNNTQKGNLMITEFAGFSYLVSQSTNTTIGVTPVTNGNPIYGCYTSSQSSMGNNPGVLFNNTSDQILFKDNNGNKFFLGEGTYPNQLRLSFDNDAYNTGAQKDMVCYGNKIALYYSDTSHTKIEVTPFCANRLDAVDMSQCTITSNSVDGSASADKMNDGDLGSYWHSSWHDRPFDTTYGVYFDVHLPSALKTFQLQYYTRNTNDNVVPRELAFWTSSDGSTWTAIEEHQTINVTIAGTAVTLPTITAAASFTYLRVRVVTSGNGTPAALSDTSGSTAIAELYIYGKNE